MIDERKRKVLLITGVVFGVLVIISIAMGAIIIQQGNLPPKEESGATPESTNTHVPEAPSPNSTKETTLYDIHFKGFGALEEKGVTPARINVVFFYLSEHAKATGGQIESYSIDQSSITQDLQSNLKKTAFKAMSNTNEVFTVELSYIYSADNFIRIFDSSGKLLQSSPTEAD